MLFKAATALQLKTDLKVLLRPLVSKYGLNLVPSEEQCLQSLDIGTVIEAENWAESMERLYDLITFGLLPHYQNVREAFQRMPDRKERDLIRSALLHKEAMQSFALCETAARSDNCVYSLIELIRYPV